MGRAATSAKAKVAAKRPVAAKSAKLEKAPAARELEKRLAAALAQQKATSEILRVISASPANVQPVLDAVAQRAARLCDAPFARVFLVDGDLLRPLADYSTKGRRISVPARPVLLRRTSISGRAALDRKTIHHTDVVPLLDREYPEARDNALAAGMRTVLAVPLMREGSAYGTIFLYRRVARRFAADQVALVQTFARQAAIAIDNVRLFHETKEALDQQTATAQILQAISNSPGDLQPVLDTVVRAAAQFCGAPDVAILRLGNGVLRGAAAVGAFGDVLTERLGSIAALELPVTRESVSGRSVVERRSIHVHDLAAEHEDEFPVGRELQRQFGHRTMVATPLMREGEPLGVIALFRAEVKPFSDKQLRLLKIFADQAVIAIENVRLFTELQARNHELTEALEQQTATSEILRVISSSPTDIQPVFDTIVRSAVRLSDGLFGSVNMFDGEMVQRPVAYHNYTPDALAAVERMYPMRPSHQQLTGRAILSRTVAHLSDVLTDPEYAPDIALAGGWRGAVAVPMLREGHPIGTVLVTRAQAGPFSDRQIALLQTFADQAVIAIENVRLFKELEQRNSALAESLEQQTATSEILRVISRSQTDAQPVFETIAASVLKLCAAGSANVLMFDGELLHIAALAIVSPDGADSVRDMYPRLPSRDHASGRAVSTRSVVAIPDVLEDTEYAVRTHALAGGFRSVLSVPLMRDETPIGAIVVGRPEPGPFSGKQIALLQTFADQAVIAIENVRLFKELEQRNSALAESLEQQTATSDILRVISQSQTDVQPVFDAIERSAVRLCGAEHSLIFTFDGDVLRPVSKYEVTPGVNDYWLRNPIRPGHGVSGRAMLARRTVHVHDVLAEPGYELLDAQKLQSYRTVLSVPMLRDEKVVGVITSWRNEVEPFTRNQIELVETFADQAVIAIENVRLFTELEARNRDITEALEQQTATGDILRAISGSPTDVQPVFDIIGERATKLCDAEVSIVSRLEGELIQLAALHGIAPEGRDAVRREFPMPISAETVTARTVRSHTVVHIADVLADPLYETKDAAMAAHFRTCLGVPMFREGQVIGAIFVARGNPEPFADTQVELLKTFADQAVIAIENVRLFTELEARTKQLTRSVGELKALGEVGEAVSSTLDLETVLRTIVSRATKLSGMDGGAVYEYDEDREEFVLRAADNLPDKLIEALRQAPMRKGEGALGQMAVTREPVQVHDIADAGVYQSRVRKVLLRLGHRSLLAVPLLRDDHLLGGLVVNRKSPGEFAPHAVELLQTFATQSALAIQNARLFREIEEKSRQLETASRHKSEFLANMSHELRTPLNAIIGFSELLSEKLFGDINAKQEEYVGDILESGRHLLALINDILDLSKIEAGRMELERTDFSLPGVIDNALTLVRERAGRHGITLARTVDERLGIIRADERKVKQVLLNLLSNALKFTPEGGRIEVRAEVQDGMAEISVTDTGVGIAPEDQEAVFEEFKQVGLTAKKVEGTGLGLAISRKFVELHGGSIWVRSQMGAGSTFTFTVPLRGDGPGRGDAAGPPAKLG